MTFKIEDLELDANADNQNYFVSFHLVLLDTPFTKLAVNLFDIDITIKKHVQNDYYCLPTGARQYYSESEYTVKVEQISFVTTQSEIFDPVTNVEKDFLLTEEMYNELTKMIGEEIIDNIESYTNEGE